jgi:hypothetical protein
MSEIPIEDNPDNYDWENTDPENTTWGQELQELQELEELEESEGQPNNPWLTQEEEAKQILIGDLYIILLTSKENPFLCKVETINEIDKKVNLSDKNDKIFIFSYDDYGNLINETEDYEAIEIINVKELNDIEQYKKEREEIEFETIIKKDFEKEYSETIMKDDLLSSLIQLYDCYDNEHKIEKIYNMVSVYTDLISKQKISKKEDTIPNYLVPIFGNDIQIYLDEGMENIKESVEANNSVGESNYTDIIKNNILHTNPFIYKEGHGYLTDQYIGDTLKDCSLTSTCTGLNGDYMYDERRTKKPLKIPRETFNQRNESYTEIIEVIPSDSILITGILEQPFDKFYYNFIPPLFDSFTLYEKTNIDEYWSKLKLMDRVKFNNLSMIDNLALEDSIKPEINDFISHNFNEIINDDKLSTILNQNLKNETDIIDLLIKTENSRHLLNMNNIHNILFKYKINYKNINDISKKKIITLLSDNISEYIDDYKDKYKREFNPIKTRKKPLTNAKRVQLVYDYIFTLLSEEKKNELLKEFINKFSRSSDKIIENPNYLYNKYTNKKLLCKHYLYSTEIRNSNQLFNTLRTKFGLPPKDGCIHCKICGEFICEEDLSTLEGFSDDVPIQSSEAMISQDNENLRKKIEEKLEKKSDIVTYITIMSTMIGVTLVDEDIYHILLSYDYLDHNILADNRYKLTGVSDTDIHPRINKLLKENKESEKKEKDPRKKDKLKKKRTKIMSEFQEWLKNTNKILILLSLVSLFIQTAVPVYNIRRDIHFKVLEVNETINDNTINFITNKFKSVTQKYNEDPLMHSIIEILNTKDTETFEEQLKRTVNYCNSPVFTLFMERKLNYKTFIKSEEKKYLKQEWTTFKPLSKNKLSLLVNEYLNSLTIDPYLRKMYGGPLIENISMIRSIEELNSVTISQKLALPTINILQNSTFRKLFRYTISCYGIHKSNTLINLFFQNLLETSDKPEELKNIMNSNGWRSDTQSFPKLSFKVLREKVIPDIFAIYNRDNNEIDTCFNLEKSCNEYIHNSVNNYDLHQLNTYPKRIYKYSPPKVYPNSSFKELDKEMINKLFSKYKFNSLGDIVENYEDINYLNDYLLDVGELNKNIEFIEEGKQITKNYDNFKLIMKFKQNKNLLKHNPVIHPIYKYTQEEYNNNKIISYTDHRLLKFLNKKVTNIKITDEDLFKTEIKKLITKLPKALSEPSEPPIEKDKLINVHLNIMKDYTDDLYSGKLKNNTLYREYFDQIFSEYMKSYRYNIITISEFLSNSDHITKDQKNRFENIFSYETKKIKFNLDSITKILNGFINSNLSYEDIKMYIRDIQNIIIHNNKNPLSSNPDSAMSNKIPKEWKTSDSVTSQFQKFNEKEEGDTVIKSYLLLHNRIFTQPRNDNYLGFNQYKTISENYHIHLDGLYNYLEDNFEDLELLKSNTNSLYNERYSVIYCKYHFINLINSIVEYIIGLMTNQTDIINDSMPLYRLLEERNEDLLEESILICTRFLMDLITHILLAHYDPTWLFMNKNNTDLTNRLSKQKEREKQENIEKVHNATPEERYLRKLKQETGQSNWFKEASDSASTYVNSEEYVNHSESERMERLQEIYSESGLEFEDVIDKVNIQGQQKGQGEEGEEGGGGGEGEEEGYLGEAELNEDGDEFLDDYDEEQEMKFNE